MKVSMHARIRFNRPIDENNDYISPGGYAMTMNGKVVEFDFEEYEANIDRDDPAVLDSYQEWLDDNYTDAENLTSEDFSNITEISEFFVFTGEQDETDLCPIAVESIVFECDGKTFSVPEKVLKEAAVCSNIVLENTEKEKSLMLDKRFYAGTAGMTSEEDIKKATELSLDIVGTIFSEIESDCENETGRILRAYELANEDQRALMDYLLVALCGYSLGSIVEKAEENNMVLN